MLVSPDREEGTHTHTHARTDARTDARTPHRVPTYVYDQLYLGRVYRLLAVIHNHTPGNVRSGLSKVLT